jgi:hypothetical protein
MPAPIILKFNPNTEIERVGYIKKKLNTTSKRHIFIFRILGVFISPLHCRELAHTILSAVAGMASAKIKKYLEESAITSFSPPSHLGR